MSHLETTRVESIQVEGVAREGHGATYPTQTPRPSNASAERHKSKLVYTTILGDNDFFRQGLIATLVHTRFRVIQEVCLLGQDGSDFALKGELCIVIASAQSSEEIRKLMLGLSGRYPDVCIAIISNNDPFWEIAKPSQLFGTLPRDISPSTLLLALELILCKEVGVGYPSYATAAILKPSKRSEDEAIIPTSHGLLSAREQQVIDLLARGHSNKGIARHLSIEENTVKAHVRTVLRKTGTTNRTQAAMKAHLFLPEGDEVI